MPRSPEPADEREFRKSLKSLRKRLSSLFMEIRRRKNRNALWRF